ncbi:MAG: bifunctional 5,10-methylene-tetrahydrofolate dehydrogenase/5,10-methylene-tetrahydrofolate cyclohydrolase [Acidaminobacter sp.]|uniref:bifunctional 5,10-methylenetetrahydrofolate dehydrogenase/5,10-methenyltetrahydrofolate cyclohydrolase n=1 Tax=Acidaminobacter sp. TaxID=1872102 RepID=UPI0013821033|nr:bifunctional 5,10-methylenetetrahydrofolate dehydrogenase/5,10-methenyltetrahydrofolate cyclohydrolase [Acidaminobacter sp.]MZQ96666.1 bifunctional 5,10-methylene-tetrahydrofolate dehydrogenase/5,10-methylene-tetrahydrofolate cyclohydrolase [Acidaminobacter sp.]
MSKILDGKIVAQHMKADMIERIDQLKMRGITPKMLIIRVGEREDDLSYEKGILKNCKALGINAEVEALSADANAETLKAVLRAANIDDRVHGIMLFRPLPPQINQEEIIKLIHPGKDIDCMSPDNLVHVFEGGSKSFVPCTAQAAVEVLKFYEVPIQGAKVAVVGRSLVVGKPLAMLLLDEHATVQICHSKTKDMATVTSNADVVIAAVGKAKFMDAGYFRKDAVVIDVGINVDELGRICGDVDFEAVADHVQAITPAVGGVGAVTTTVLLNNVVLACERMNP